jgi:NmrA-like family
MTKLWRNALQCIGEALDIHNLDRESGKIFITETTSEVGRQIASRLIHTGYAQVRVGSTFTSNHTNKLHIPINHHEGGTSNIEIVEFAWNREETYANALNGVKSVIITIPYRRSWYTHFSAFLKACKKANVKHYVKLSFYLSHVPGTRQIPFVKHHTNCDEMLMNMVIPDVEHVSQMSYTIIAASHFMSNPIHFYSTKLSRSADVASSATLWNASMNRTTNYISPSDVAYAVARVVLSPHDHYNKVYTILGPELISHDDLVTLMTLYFGKQIKCVECINLTDYRNKFMESYMKTPLWYMKDCVAMEQLRRSGLEENILDVIPNDFVRICGRAPETFYHYLTYRSNDEAAMIRVDE